FSEPGTRSMSPNEQKITFWPDAIMIALSISSSGVTHTGQPGPLTSSTLHESNSSMPYLTMACVWPPQTSIKVHGRVTISWIDLRKHSTAFAALYVYTDLT